MHEEDKPSETLPGATAPARDQSEQSPEDAARQLALTIPVKEGIAPLPTSGVIRDLVEAGVRGHAAMMLLQSILERLEGDLASNRRDLERCREQVEDWKDRYHGEKATNSVLVERLRSLRGTQNLQSLALTLGGIVAGVAVPHLRDPSPGLAWAAVALSLLLLIAGWLRPKEKEEK